MQEENDFIAAEAALASDRLVPFGSANPKRDYAVEELTRCVERLGMRGLKTHFANSDVRLGDPHHVQRVREVFARAAEKNIPVVAHIFNERVDGFGPKDVEILVSHVLEPLRTLRITIAHLGGGGGFDRQVQRTFKALIAAVADRPPRSHAGSGSTARRSRTHLRHRPSEPQLRNSRPKCEAPRCLDHRARPVGKRH